MVWSDTSDLGPEWVGRLEVLARRVQELADAFPGDVPFVELVYRVDAPGPMPPEWRVWRGDHERELYGPDLDRA
jgi:hypothetical protein